MDCTLAECSESAGGCTLVPLSARCDDGLFCTGIETCDVMRGCVSGPSLACPDDGIACTDVACSETERRCATTVVDRDGDGSLALACGGSDCDDGNADVSGDLPERCGDRLDNDCDGQIDCDDSDCIMSPFCMTPCEAFESRCDDGSDDWHIDAQKWRCRGLGCQAIGKFFE